MDEFLQRLCLLPVAGFDSLVRDIYKTECGVLFLLSLKPVVDLVGIDLEAVNGIRGLWQAAAVLNYFPILSEADLQGGVLKQNCDVVVADCEAANVGLR